MSDEKPPRGARKSAGKLPRKRAAERPTREPRPERRAAFRVGISAESRAAAWLIAHGYRILARR